MRIYTFIKKQRLVLTCCFVLGILGCTSCIKNDIPYPKVNLLISELVFESQIGDPIINNEERTVKIQLADTTNIRRVCLRSVKITDQATSELTVGEFYDLSQLLQVNLQLYDTKTPWVIKAIQHTDRKFKVTNQIGTADFFPEEHYATALIPKEHSLKKLKLEELQLGPEGSTINGSTDLPELTWKTHGNFAEAKVKLTYKNYIVDQEWTLYVFRSETSVVTKAADAWTQVAWLYGQGKEGNENGFEWKEKDAEKWNRVDPSLIQDNKGDFSARLSHLKPQTDYVCRAYSGADYGAELNFTTSAIVPLPGGLFDEWHKDPSKEKVWNPWALNGTQYWDSGNDGATTLGESISVPTDDTWNGQGQAAMLQSKFIGIGSIGKFAAGNLFAGKYVKTDGTNGILSFGIPFQERPTKMKGYFKYKTTPIKYIPSKSVPEDYERFLPYMDQPDTCFIYAALGDWNEPVEIRTRASNRKLFDKKDPHVIAYAELNCGEDVNEYKPFELTLEYRATDRKPKYLLVVCSASKYGDFFTGGEGTILWVDDFTFDYDY